MGLKLLTRLQNMFQLYPSDMFIIVKNFNPIKAEVHFDLTIFKQ